MFYMLLSKFISDIHYMLTKVLNESLASWKTTYLFDVWMFLCIFPLRSSSSFGCPLHTSKGKDFKECPKDSSKLRLFLTCFLLSLLVQPGLHDSEHSTTCFDLIKPQLISSNPSMGTWVGRARPNWSSICGITS